MYLNGLGTAVPPARYDRHDCWTAFMASPWPQRLTPRARAVARAVLTGDNGIDSRHLAVDSLAEAFAIDPDVLQQRFATHAPRLAAEAGARALRDAALPPVAIDAVVVSTCTGYLCPGLSGYVAERLGLRTDVQALDLVGQGCGAALPNLRTAAALLAGGGCAHVLSVCVEISSAAMYLDDDPGVIISACLFGDGAGAAVLGREPGPRRRIRWHAADTRLDPAQREALRFETRGGMLRNVLTREVPALAGTAARDVLDRMLARHDVAAADIGAWIVHAGGRDVLAALRERIGLTEHQLRFSAEALRAHGNLSSAFVFFVLEAARQREPRGGWWWLTAFGAGFTCHGALLEVADA